MTIQDHITTYYCSLEPPDRLKRIVVLVSLHGD